MLLPPVIQSLLSHLRVVCADCFDVIQECPCGTGDKTTHWRLCAICMGKKPEKALEAQDIPEGTLLDARLVMTKILPLVDYPKEFIPVRLHPGYDQWRDKVLKAIMSSGAMPPTPKEGESHDRGSEGSKVQRDPGTGDAEPGGAGSALDGAGGGVG